MFSSPALGAEAASLSLATPTKKGFGKYFPKPFLVGVARLKLAASAPKAGEENIYLIVFVNVKDSTELL